MNEQTKKKKKESLHCDDLHDRASSSSIYYTTPSFKLFFFVFSIYTYFLFIRAENLAIAAHNSSGRLKKWVLLENFFLLALYKTPREKKRRALFLIL